MGALSRPSVEREDLIETRGCEVGIIQIFILISVLSIKLHTLETVDGKMWEIEEASGGRTECEKWRKEGNVLVHLTGESSRIKE